MLRIIAAHPTITEYRVLFALCAILEREGTSVSQFLPSDFLTLAKLIEVMCCQSFSDLKRMGVCRMYKISMCQTACYQ